MTIRSVRILSEAAASALPPTPLTAIFSITDPGRQTTLQPGWPRIHRHQVSETAYDARTHELAPLDHWIAGGAISPRQAVEIRQQIAARRYARTVGHHLPMQQRHQPFCGHRPLHRRNQRHPTRASPIAPRQQHRPRPAARPVVFRRQGTPQSNHLSSLEAGRAAPLAGKVSAGHRHCIAPARRLP